MKAGMSYTNKCNKFQISQLTESISALFMSHALSLLIRQRDNRSSITAVCVSEWPVQSTATPQSNAIYVVVTRYYNSTQNQSST